jgi:hypothetical protein
MVTLLVPQDFLAVFLSRFLLYIPGVALENDRQ